MELLALTAVLWSLSERRGKKEAELAARERRIEYEKTEKIMGQEVVAEKGTVWTVQ